MPVKIIEAKPDESVVKRVVRGHCGVKLEYVPVDIQYRSVRDYDGTADTAYWIGCPNCKFDVTVGRR